MERIIFIGYGYMAKNINNAISKTTKKEVYYIDKFHNEGDRWYASIEDFLKTNKNINDFIFFICSPSNTHFEYLESLIKIGAKYIFVEKPAFLKPSEHDILKPLIERFKPKIFVGYILRFSGIFEIFKKNIRLLKENGFSLSLVNVYYQKKKLDDPRNKFDIGVYEEYFHIADLLLNVIIQDDSIQDISIKKSRVISKRLIYLESELRTTDGCHIDIVSSFISQNKKRDFIIKFIKGQESAEIHLYFDKDGDDIIRLFYNESLDHEYISPANIKLDIEISKALEYFFDENFNSEIHHFDDSRKIAKLTDTIERLVTNENAI
ncbi:Gfo/Idh/MocA family oxidoreductase [Brenneria goodwinii]|uniref:Gfo/Idh/MocA family oxidoreductase n=1 Tax=Brenneria goodwinii TaxID=1109412 RepID=UPI0036EDF470